MKVVIDRFEGQYAVCEMEDKTMINIERKKLPHDAKEGDTLEVIDGAISIDNKETAKSKKEIEDIADDLWKK